MKDSTLIQQIDERIAYLMDSPFWHTKKELLIDQYIQDNNNIDRDTAYRFFVDGIIKQYKDRTLDYLWYQYQSNGKSAAISAA